MISVMLGHGLSLDILLGLIDMPMRVILDIPTDRLSDRSLSSSWSH